MSPNSLSPHKPNTDDVETGVTYQTEQSSSSSSTEKWQDEDSNDTNDSEEEQSKEDQDEPISKKDKPIHERKREFLLVIIVGICLSFNSGYINGCCLSGLLSDGGSRRQGVSAFTGTYTASALNLAEGDALLFFFQLRMIASFILGAFISGVINPKSVPYRIGPTYGPTFLIGSVLLAISSALSFTDPNGELLFYFAACANGVQNGMSSMYSGNLIRSTHLTGTSTDIGLILGQVARGHRASMWKLGVLMILACSFWFGGFISFFAAKYFTSMALVFNACFFFLIGVGCIVYVMVTHHISLAQAAFGSWEWDVALDTLAASHRDSEQHGSDEELLLDLFDKIDDDGNGFIEDEELASALREQNMEVTRKSIRRMMKVVDKDQDGTISRDEWVEFVTEKMKHTKYGRRFHVQFRSSSSFFRARRVKSPEKDEK